MLPCYFGHHAFFCSVVVRAQVVRSFFSIITWISLSQVSTVLSSLPCVPPPTSYVSKFASVATKDYAASATTLLASTKEYTSDVICSFSLCVLFKLTNNNEIPITKSESIEGQTTELLKAAAGKLVLVVLDDSKKTVYMHV